MDAYCGKVSRKYCCVILRTNDYLVIENVGARLFMHARRTSGCVVRTSLKSNILCRVHVLFPQRLQHGLQHDGRDCVVTLRANRSQDE